MTEVRLHTADSSHCIIVDKPALDKVRHSFNPSGNEAVEAAKLTIAAFIQLCYDLSSQPGLRAHAEEEIKDAINFAHAAQMKLVGAITAHRVG